MLYVQYQSPLVNAPGTFLSQRGAQKNMQGGKSKMMKELCERYIKGSKNDATTRFIRFKDLALTLAVLRRFMNTEPCLTVKQHAHPKTLLKSCLTSNQIKYTRRDLWHMFSSYRHQRYCINLSKMISVVYKRIKFRAERFVEITELPSNMQLCLGSSSYELSRCYIEGGGLFFHFYISKMRVSWKN